MSTAVYPGAGPGADHGVAGAPARQVGLFLATMLVASNIVGSGIFLLPATMAALGSMTMVAWLIATAGAVLLALVLGKLAEYAPESGGPCSYAAVALGPFMGFQGTALYWISCWIADAAIAVAAVSYASYFVPALRTPHASAWAAIGLIWALTAVTWWSPRMICQIGTVAMMAGLAPIMLVAIGGWMAFHPAIFMAAWNTSGKPMLTALPRAVVWCYWAFAGLESASIATAIVQNPRRNVMRASVGGVLLSAVVYLAACGVIMGMIPAAQLAHSSAPFADAARLVLGRTVAGVVAVMALLKVAGSVGGWLLVTMETGKAGAERGLFPVVFARVDRQGRPGANLFLVALIASAAVWLTISPTTGQQFGKLIEASTILALLLYMYACLAIWHYRALAPDRFRGYRTIAMGALLACLTTVVLADMDLLALTAVVVVLMVPLYPLCVRRAAASGGGG